MSLYGKYRPHSFADVVGQDAIVTTLEQAAAQGKLAHAYLFAGMRGTGKTTIARILAKHLMVQGIEDEAVKKQIIEGIEDGSIVDLLEIDAASNRGIDDVRDLIEKIQFSPVVAGAKVYIVDEVHMLTKEAFNALLKTLEEPPEYAYFILATTELNKIPATIQSRCQSFPFRSIPEDEIIRRLQYIADQEKITVDREALRAIAHHVEGGLRDAISFLDQLRSLEKITITDVEERIGGTSTEHIESIFAALESKDPQKIIEVIRAVEATGVSLDVLVRMLLSTVRDALHKAIEEKKNTNELSRMLSILLNAIRDLRTAPVPGLVLESALLSLCCTEESSAAPAKVVVPPKAEAKETSPAAQSKSEEEEKIETTKEEIKEMDPEPVKKEEQKPETIEAPELSFESIKSSWPDIVKETNPASVRMSLKNARLVELNGNTLTLGFDSDFHKDKVEAPDGARAIEENIEKHFSAKVRLKCIVEAKADIGPAEDDINIAEAASEIF